MENGIYWIAYIVDNLVKECLTDLKTIAQDAEMVKEFNLAFTFTVRT